MVRCSQRLWSWMCMEYFKWKTAKCGTSFNWLWLRMLIRQQRHWRNWTSLSMGHCESPHGTKGIHFTNHCHAALWRKSPIRFIQWTGFHLSAVGSQDVQRPIVYFVCLDACWLWCTQERIAWKNLEWSGYFKCKNDRADNKEWWLKNIVFFASHNEFGKTNEAFVFSSFKFI